MEKNRGTQIHCPRGCALVQLREGRGRVRGLPPSAGPQGIVEPEPPLGRGRGGLAMKQIMWALVLIGLLLVGSTLPAEVAAGGPGGGGGGARSAGGGGWHGGGPRGGGGWYGGGGGWYGGPRVFIGGGVGWWGWPGWWGAPYPYYAAPPVVVQPTPMEYIQQGPAPPQQSYWYYCQNAGAYYPYVKECPGGWMQVVPQPAPPGP